MSEPKKYTFKKLSDMAEVVTEENLDVLAADLKAWLGLAVIAKQLNEPGVLKTKLGDFKWIDDGKNDIDISVQFKTAKKLTPTENE